MKFELQSFGTSILRILNIATGKYLAMDSKGMLHTRVRLPILYALLFFLNFFTCLEVVLFFNILFFHKSFIQSSFPLERGETSQEGPECFRDFLQKSSLNSGAPNGNFRENFCSEDDLRSRIFGAFVVKFLACLPLLGFSNIYKMI